MSTGTRIALFFGRKVPIIKDVEIEGPGLIEYCLNQKRISYRVVSLGLGTRLPKPITFSHIVVPGGQMNVYEEDRYLFK